MNDRSIRIEVVTADAMTFPADVLVLKHARQLHGASQAAFHRLFRNEHPPLQLAAGEFAIYPTKQKLGVESVLFLGVEPLRTFRYAEIRAFGRRALAAIDLEAPKAQHIAFTIHGPGYGLDEIEAFESLLGGIIEGVSHDDCPSGLRRITIVERESARAERLKAALQQLLRGSDLVIGHRSPLSHLAQDAREVLRSVGYSSEAKPRAFVAMPFAPEMDDIFHYGIEGAIKSAGMLCERADTATFTGEIVAWIKERISTSRLVVADLTGANPNVYLEVGYAWGKGIPTVLLCRDPDALKFDVKGHRCLIYGSIKQLEEALTRELKGLAMKEADPLHS